MSSVASPTVTPPACQIRAGKLVGWKQIFHWHKLLKSEVEKTKRKHCPYRAEIQGRCLIFILSTFFSCSGGERLQWELLVHVIDMLESSRCWLQSFINETELFLNSLSLSLSLSVPSCVSHSFSALMFLPLPPYISQFFSLSLSLSVSLFSELMLYFSTPSDFAAGGEHFQCGEQQHQKWVLLQCFAVEHTTGDYRQCFCRGLCGHSLKK